MDELIKFLRKSFENARGKRAQDTCEKVLGDPGKVEAFSVFFQQHEEDTAVFVAAKLNEWASKNSFSDKELDLYKLGLTEFPLFFAECLAERNRKNEEKITEIRQMSSQRPIYDGTCRYSILSIVIFFNNKIQTV